MRKRILSATLAVATVAALGAGAATAANASSKYSKSRTPVSTGYNQSAAAGPLVLCSNAGGAIYAYSSACPAGLTLETKASLTGPAGAKGDKGDPGSAASAGTKIVHKTVTVNPDFQAGTLDQRTFTISGLPPFQVGGTAEIWGSNAGDLPAYIGDITVTRVSPSNGETTRKFVVTPNGFTGTESFTLDVWVLITT